MPRHLLTGREALYKASREPTFVDVPEIGFLMVDGHGDPNTTPAYAEALRALYALSYAIRFALRNDEGLDYRVGPLEGLWWADDMAAFADGRRAEWSWTMMIAQPDPVTRERVHAVHARVAARKDAPTLAGIRFERLTEGRCAQILHVGPFGAEGPTIARLHAFIVEHGARFDVPGLRHHEIYLSDPRRAAPDRLKTIIRQPVAP